MSSSDFNFLPRKLSKQLGKPTQPRAAISSQLKSFPAEVDTNPYGECDYNVQRQAGPSKPRREDKILEDSDYARLLALALTDYALWSNRELSELMDANEENFISLRHLLNMSPVLSGLTPMPSESTFVRCIKDSKTLERRMIVSTQTLDDGGFEVRRRDWEATKERLRRYTSFQWDGRTLYVENLPPSARSVPSVLRFLQDVFEEQSRPDEAQSAVQAISFPQHREDSPDGPLPTKSKGFAFVILSRTLNVDRLLQRWPWRPEDRPMTGRKEGSQSEADATASGFRCMSKRTWDKLRVEYLARQRQLLEESVARNIAESEEPLLAMADPPQSLRGDVEDEEEPSHRKRAIRPVISMQTPQPQPYSSAATYPKDCLVFIKNVHPETNKTTLKNLFSKPLNGEGGAIDYVDYNKGLDSCYLRLISPEKSRMLVQHFKLHKTFQANGLDSLGSTSPPGASDSIEIELVQGMKEEVYWEKVPEKVRRQAMEKAGKQILADSVVDELSVNNATAGERKPKRRKR